MEDYEMELTPSAPRASEEAMSNHAMNPKMGCPAELAFDAIAVSQFIQPSVNWHQ